MYHSAICGLLLNVVLFKTAFASSEYGFLKVKAEKADSIEICLAYNSNFKAMPIETPSNTIPWNDWNATTSLYPSLGCNLTDYISLQQSIAIVKRGDCTFYDKALNVQKSDGIGVLVVNVDNQLIIPGADEDKFDAINISVAVIKNIDYLRFEDYVLKYGQENVKVYQYTIAVPSHIDINSIAMWLLAVITCAVGGWLQGLQFSNNTKKPSTSPSSLSNSSHSSNDSKSNGKKVDTGIIVGANITIGHAVFFFFMCSTSILLMYFFFDYLVYFIIGVFTYASALSLFDLIYSMFKNFSCMIRYKIPENKIPVLKQRPPICVLFLLTLCITFAIMWAVYRKEPFAWIMQDILGVSFCIYMIKTIKLSNFKISCVLLILFFIYDVFYVFVTPLFTKDHESVMMHVATGGSGNTQEELPMLFKLPKFNSTPLYRCIETTYSLLGYGDVILPGLHVGFCSSWDEKISTNSLRTHSYFFAAIIGYGTGLIITFIALFLMMTGQPALLYLVPCCLLSTFGVALKRKELHAIWKGEVNPVTIEQVPHVSGSVNTEEKESLL